MSASAWDGCDRAPLRYAIAAIAAVEAVVLAGVVATTQPGPLTHPVAPTLLLAPGGRPSASAAIAAVALVGLAVFARGRRPLPGGAIALAALAWLVEAHAALVGGPMRVLFTEGAVLAGWLFGLAFAARLRARGGALPGGAEALAELGAIGALAATYVNSAISKLAGSGTTWADTTNLRALVACHHHAGDTSILGAYADAVIRHGTLAQALSVATLVIQASAFLCLLGPRIRALSGALLLGFHLNVWLLTHIAFVQASALILLLCFPWPRIFGVRRADAGAESSAIGGVGRPSLEAATVILVTVVLALATPLRSYTLMHHRGDASKATPPPPPPEPDRDARAAIGGLAAGDRLGDFQVVALVAEGSGGARVTLKRGEATIEVMVVPIGSWNVPAPVETRAHSIYYGHVLPERSIPDADRDALLAAMAERVGAAEKGH